MKHILVISQYFYPEDFRINDICSEWIKKGYQVTVVTGIPNYPEGKFYKGFGWFRKRTEEYNGVKIIRLPIISRGKGSLRLMMNYASYVFAGFFWKCFTKVKADRVFIFEVSPMTQALVGVWYAKRRHIPCDIYVQDLWPENVITVTGLRNQAVIRSIKRMVNYIYRNCSSIFTTSQSFVGTIRANQEIADRVFYWPQYAEAFYQKEVKQELPDLQSKTVLRIVFTGNIGYAQGLQILPKTAAILQTLGQKCEFVIIGNGRYMEELTQGVREQGVEDYFIFLGRKKPTEISAYLAACDVAFISFADNELFAKTIPAKLQSYLACGMPILAAAKGETKRIVEEADCGLVCSTDAPTELADNIIAFCRMESNRLKQMSENASCYSKSHFGRELLLNQMDEFLNR